MSETGNTSLPPSNDEIQEALDSAEQVRDEVVHYRNVAQDIDDRFERENEGRRLYLDDLPYGEELIRTRDFPELLDQSIKDLKDIADGNVPAEKIPQLFQDASQVIEDAGSTLDDCTSLPPEDEEDDI